MAERDVPEVKEERRLTCRGCGQSVVLKAGRDKVVCGVCGQLTYRRQEPRRLRGKG